MHYSRNNEVGTLLNNQMTGKEKRKPEERGRTRNAPVKIRPSLLQIKYQYKRNGYVRCESCELPASEDGNRCGPMPPRENSATTSLVWALKYATLGTGSICAH